MPIIEPKERCVIVLTENEGGNYFPKGKTFLSGYCRCQFYYWSIDKIGKIGEPKDYSIEKCNNLVGFSFKDSADIYEFQEKVRLYIKSVK
jgi:hypothetical protein